jgi:hypothetical protein
MDGSDVYTGNSLHAFYASLGMVRTPIVFEGMLAWGILAWGILEWNSMMDGYVSNGNGACERRDNSCPRHSLHVATMEGQEVQSYVTAIIRRHLSLILHYQFACCRCSD